LTSIPDVLGTQVGRLVTAEFADPHRLAMLGVARFVRFARHRGLRVRRSCVDRLVAVARTALPSPEAAVARQVLADDLVLLADLDPQVLAAEAHMARLLPDTPFAPLISVPAGARSEPPTTAARRYGQQLQARGKKGRRDRLRHGQPR
jgi:transposase